MSAQYNLSVLFRVVDKATAPLKQVARTMQRLTAPVRAVCKSVRKLAMDPSWKNIKSATESVRRAIVSMAQKSAAALNRLSNKMRSFGKSMRDVGTNLTMKLTAPLVGFSVLAIKAAADIETMQVSFESMLGSGEKASKMVEDLIQFTARTPFQLEGVGKSAKQLLAFGVASEDIQETLTYLGDVAAGANVPLSDMASILGKCKSKGKAYTEELLQMSDRGVPIIGVLAEKFGVAKEAIFDMASEGKISFKMIEGALKSMSRKGGIFENQMERQSRTIAGIFSTLKDNIMLSLGKIGQLLVEELNIKKYMKELISVIQRLTERFIEFAKVHPRLVKIGLAIAGIAIVLGPVIIALGVFAAAIGALCSPVGAALLALAALGGAVIYFWDDLKRVWKGITEFVANVKNMLFKFGADIKNFFQELNPFGPLLEKFQAVSSRLSGMKNWVSGKFGGSGGAPEMIKATNEARTASMTRALEGKEARAAVDIRLHADERTSASVEKVKKQKGDMSVNIASIGYVGAH